MDIRIDNPVGRVPDPTWMSVTTLRTTPRGWRMGRRHGRYDGSLLAQLRSLDNSHELRVVDGGTPDAARDEVAGFLVRAIARGTHVRGTLSEGLRAAAPPGLTDLVGPVAADRAGDLSWDIACVSQRRAVLRRLVPELPTVSLVLVSRRPELIVPMVRRLSTLDYPRIEIVVAQHGGKLPEGLADAAGDVPLVVKRYKRKKVFGEVLQKAFALASGDLVAKVDDDDYVGDGHLLDLVLAHRYSGATLVGKSTTVVYLEALDTTVRRLYGVREGFTHRVAGGTFLLSPEDLAAVGGWAPVPRAVDTHLIEAIQREHGTIYLPHDIGYLYMRRSDPTGHTWATGIEHFLRNTREQWIGLLRHHEFGTEDAA